MAITSTEIRGIERLIARMRSLERNVAKKIIRRGMRSAAKVIQAEAKRRAPYKSGRLRRGIRVRAIRRSRKSFGVKVSTAPREFLGIPPDAPGYYPAVLEYGSKKRKIEAVRYMANALETKRAEAIRAAAETMRGDIRGIA